MKWYQKEQPYFYVTVISRNVFETFILQKENTAAKNISHSFFFIENYVENSADLDWIIENIRPLNQLLKLKIRKFCLLTVTNCKFWQLSYSVLRFVYVVKYEKKFIWICVRNRFILLTKEVLTSQVKSSQDLLALTDWKEKEKENV